jgi:LPXTG-motif cell wall-anchored protein
MTIGNLDSYIKLRPVPGMLRPVAAKVSSGKSNGTTMAIVGAVVVVVAGGGIWLLRRRGARRGRQPTVT